MKCNAKVATREFNNLHLCQCKQSFIVYIYSFHVKHFSEWIKNVRFVITLHTLNYIRFANTLGIYIQYHRFWVLRLRNVIIFAIYLCVCRSNDAICEMPSVILFLNLKKTVKASLSVSRVTVIETVIAADVFRDNTARGNITKLWRIEDKFLEIKFLLHQMSFASRCTCKWSRPRWMLEKLGLFKAPL